MNFVQRKIYLYNVTFGLYMLEWWERYLFNILIIVLLWFICYNGSRSAAEFYKSLLMQLENEAFAGVGKIRWNDLLPETVFLILLESPLISLDTRVSLEAKLNSSAKCLTEAEKMKYLELWGMS
ncbi:hypothetical protein C5167_006897 [Papaver somniferum]|uniref:Uncharacterized protein n=1 Tax=Papaver somniferum TaxID=3469 RepID=A0A4Y7JEM4_PAPSO|nr:hypothetical protein C5167_006897 [Papaver somniferum]